MEPFEARVTPSLLDRLTDHAPNSPAEHPLSRLQALRVLKASLWYDLSALLNTKRREEEVPEQFTEVNRSLLTYGLPDFSSYGLKSEADQHRLRRAIEAAIRRFEPRLEKVTVTLEAPQETDPALRFRVDALLRVEPAPEPISFETVLQPESAHFVIMGDTR
ncbi:MAG: type VI secretion system baseplate subunit TssE [Bryobacteraceae bacterium]